MKLSSTAIIKYLWFLALLAILAPFASAQSSLASQVLVVYDPTNTNSTNVANHYVASRKIPTANLCAVSPPETLIQLSWSTYVSAMKTPIQNCLTSVGPSQILYIVLSYIRPFSILAQNGKVYDLDSYIEDIWDQYSTVDAFPFPVQAQPYFAGNQAQGNVYQSFQSFATYRSQQGALEIYSVWRLDGATPALAEGLVDKAATAEASGLSGQVCIDRNGGAINNELDSGSAIHEWDLHMAAVFAGQAGLTVIEDQNPQEFGTPPAPNCPNAALFAGWYSLNHYNNAFTWNPGAIGIHLDSLSALDPRSGTNWSANAIINGITATSGVISEPLTQAFPHPDGVFLDLLSGANIGDAILRNTIWLKWMNVHIGDPLYQPFAGGLAPFNGSNQIGRAHV